MLMVKFTATIQYADDTPGAPGGRWRLSITADEGGQLCTDESFVQLLRSVAAEAERLSTMAMHAGTNTVQ